VASVAIDYRPSWPDEEASRLYAEHSPWLLGYCRRQLGGGNDAEDAVQTTFLYAFRALRRGVVPECERAWLTTIARNVCSTQRRVKQRRPEDSTELDLDRIALAQPDMDEAGFVDDVRAALASLPANQRRALVLREWQGVPSNEIATEMELSEPATHALLFRARKSFASALDASRRPVAGLNIAVLVEQLRAWLKPLLGGAAVKAAAATTAAGVVVGGAVIEQRTSDGPPPPTPTMQPAATVGSPPGTAATPPSSSRPTQRIMRPPRPVPVVAPASRARAAVSPATPAGPDATIERVARPPREAAEPTSPAPPPVAEAPSPPPRAPIPPVDPPAPPPVELPPILGEEPVPTIELPPPLDELLPPVEVPPLPPLPVPQLPLP
jgi:RNA polymerase sigma factor (sigma-70 family)